MRALRQLEDDYLVMRLEHGTEYALTTDGEKLEAILRDIAHWQSARTGAKPRSVNHDDSKS